MGRGEVGNELGGWNTDTRLYVKEMVNYIKRMDTTRIDNYGSNTLVL